MGATQRLFKYKCNQAHETSAAYPLGTRFDDHDEIICSVCHEPAYLVSAEVVQAKDTFNGRRSS